MRRLFGWLALALGISAFGAAGQANAAAFVWIAAPAWSYSAAACAAAPGPVFASFWGLSVGAGSTSFAVARCAGFFGGSGAFAIARAGVGGAGGGFALGIADPYAGVGIDVSLTDPLSGLGASTDTNDETDASSEFSGTPTLSGTGDDFSSETEAHLNGVDELEAFVDPALANDGSESDICTALGEGSSCTSGSTATEIDQAELDALFGGAPIATELDPTSMDWSFADADPGDTIIVAFGDAAAPEPASIMLLGQGLIGLGLLARRRRRRT